MTASIERPDGHCAVDIRLFLFTLVVSMTGAFLAGVSFVPPPSATEFYRTSLAAAVAKSAPLERPKADLQKFLDHSPSGHHLLVDIQGIEADFLDSEERLSDALVQTVHEAGLTLLSYHCHKLMPAGISCVGVLLESHISFHTWPEEGVITLDLFTCGANPLLPALPVVERLFGIGERIETKWAHELRGFRSIEERKANYLDNLSDLALWVLGPLDVHSKKMIYSDMTKHQRVDIWDIVLCEDFPSFEDGIKHNFTDGDPRWEKNSYVTPDRVLFLDGIVQSMYSHENEYHEALVHPVMFVHPGPVHVGIIGGGEGATLREVLKHESVQQVTMVEIDAELIGIAREYLPKMSNCSNLVGRAENCFDDDRVELVHDNAIQWFNDRYSTEATKPAPKALFDCLIVDALDPEDEVPFTNELYVDSKFVGAIMNSLSEKGVIMIQIGTAPELLDPKPDVGMYKIRHQMFHLFESHPDVAAMHVYEEPKSGFNEPHSFMIICKDISCQKRWYAKSDAIDYEIYDRIVETKSGKGALRHYDGVTHNSYQHPTMSWEAVYCRQEPTPFECAYRSLDFHKEIFEMSFDDENNNSFDIRVGEAPGVFAKVDIPKGSYIMPEQLSRSLVLQEETIDGIKAAAALRDQTFVDLEKFVASHSHQGVTIGAGLSYLEVGASILIRNVASKEDANIGRWVPLHPNGRRPVFSPVYDRHRVSFDTFMVATKDIPAGTELTRSSLW